MPGPNLGVIWAVNFFDAINLLGLVSLCGATIVEAFRKISSF